ncbi:MAG TPA: malto-oligosyltrehalose trehalohydrolase [Bacteroidales bacterium]|nr:malto-oligosyltrehalose trehalohydrolase [Bacteroidales bacterium]
MKAGAHIESDGSCRFTVWAPAREHITLHIVSPSSMEIPMIKSEDGYFSVTVLQTGGDCRYFYNPDGKGDYPDPASDFQPEGVHGPSQVVDHGRFVWKDHAWKGLPFSDLIFYELHVGTFTADGTFQAVIPYLEELRETGINALELMPVSQFPGSRNWGYDGVFPYSVQNTYGGPEGLKKLVDEAHRKGIAIFLDVVYNHIGPEGNYFGEFGPYFIDRYRVPWGDAINFDGEWSDGVREYFSGNPVHWFTNYHIDGLRADAIHMIFDSGAVHFWELTNKKIRKAEQLHGRKFHMVAESDLNSRKVVRSPDAGGYGFDAQWLDDYHHALYVLLHPEGKERYEDFGTLGQLAKAYKDGFVHSGEFVKFRKRRHGESSAGIPGEKFVAFNQNHDQIGNRVMGERLCMLTGFRQMKMAAAALLLSPYVPLLFMGEEYGDENPFFYFVSHSDEELIKAVREGRKKEFESYHWNVEPPDPQDECTFTRSRISWEKRYSGKHKILLDWNKELIRLRKTRDALKNTNKDGISANVPGKTVFSFVRTSEEGNDYVYCIFNFSDEESSTIMPEPKGTWMKILDSADSMWKAPGEDGVPASAGVNSGESILVSAWSTIVYTNIKNSR